MNDFVENILQNRFAPAVTSCYHVYADVYLSAALLCYTYRCNWWGNLGAVNCMLHSHTIHAAHS